MSINIAITKGRLEQETVKIFEKAQFDIDELKNKGRKLIFQDKSNLYKYFLVKGADAITYVEHGVADVGIVGKDTLIESDLGYYELMDLGVGRCKFIMASLPNTEVLNAERHIKIGTKYPVVAKKYFQSKNMDVEIIKIEGSVELAPLLGLCDAIVDIMETGTTLKENGLIVIDEICNISARVIVNRASFKLKQKEIEDFLDKVRKVL
ncbi:ATP phosphoribosyltransferase [Inconstantimicrobium mannanitabidum]|uniref:ATP phosphoribosyltransferase n=1 Tax=Inconstantimicrobium mannanitabidum TaxID=1604901 RepID=A0ACB5RCY4_9CLOT|nr:ATP phosphoribosyltransferase [Clostridium sp. TW13]GKX66950.1 ATP phosphoribosyltransferase [Clostridium sp. TW13]